MASGYLRWSATNDNVMKLKVIKTPEAACGII
jgi:hypothetical protein